MAVQVQRAANKMVAVVAIIAGALALGVGDALNMPYVRSWRFLALALCMVSAGLFLLSHGYARKTSKSLVMAAGSLIAGLGVVFLVVTYFTTR